MSIQATIGSAISNLDAALQHLDYDRIRQARELIEETMASLEDDYDPTPWCSGCGSMTKAGCHCGPMAENE